MDAEVKEKKQRKNRISGRSKEPGLEMFLMYGLVCKMDNDSCMEEGRKEGLVKDRGQSEV